MAFKIETYGIELKGHFEENRYIMTDEEKEMQEKGELSVFQTVTHTYNFAKGYHKEKVSDPIIIKCRRQVPAPGRAFCRSGVPAGRGCRARRFQMRTMPY